MKIRYLGPCDSVNVAPHGPHPAGEIREYPDEFGADLLSTSQKQRFEAAEEDPPAPPEPESESESEPEPEAEIVSPAPRAKTRKG